MFIIGNSFPVATNCVFWGSSDSSGMDESAQIHVDNGAPVVNYSDLQGGWTGAGGTGNINADPLFVDADRAHAHVGPDEHHLKLIQQVGVDFLLPLEEVVKLVAGVGCGSR